MMQTLRQWISRVLALAVIGPIASWIAGGLSGVDGSGDHTLLTGDSMGSGVLALLAVCALTIAMGGIGSFLGGRREALLGMGFVLGWVAWTSGRVGVIYRLSPEVSTGVALSLETVLLACSAVLGGVLASRSDAEDAISSFHPSRLVVWLRDSALLGAMGASLAAAVVVSWLFAVQDLPGQSTGVGCMAGVLAGVVGAMAASSMRGKGEHHGTPYAPIMLGVMLAGVVLPLVGLIHPGLDAVEMLQLRGELPGYMVLSPSAWVAGALIGVPVGHSWMEQTETRVHRSAAASR